MSLQAYSPPGTDLADVPLPSSCLERQTFVLRTGCAADGAQIHGLIQDHAKEGHLLPRQLGELAGRAHRFVVAVSGVRIIACAELARLSDTVAEVRSLVVDRDRRHEGLGRRLVDELARRARLDGFESLSAFTHGPGYFVRMGFSIVPRHWVREKILVDCHTCPLFGTCEQQAVVLSLQADGETPRRAGA